MVAKERSRVKFEYNRGLYRRKARARALRLRRGVYRKGTDRPYFIKRSTRTVNGFTQLANDFAGPAFYGLKFQLDDLPNYTEFSSLFDNYQIMCVVLKLLPVQNQMNTGLSGAVEVPTIGYCWDYDDATTPTSMDQLRQYATYKEQLANKPVTIKVYPKVALVTYQGGVSNGYLRPSAKLQKMFRIDCANPSVQHFGIKIGIPNTGAPDNTITYDIHATYYMKFTGLI